MFFHLAPKQVEGLIISVDMFFVISGYLITGTYLKSDSIGYFYAGRVRRVFPALIVILVASLTAGLAGYEPRSLNNLAKEVIASGLFSQNIWLATQTGYFDLAGYERPLLHLWTLAIEEQFYLVWPLVLWKLKSLNDRRFLFFSSVSAFAFLGLTLIKSFVHPNPADYFLPWMRLWALLAGGLLAIAERLGVSWINHGKRWFGMTGAALIVIGFVFTDRSNHLQGMVVLAVLGSLLVIASGPQGWINQHVLSIRPLVWIGLLSYPLYLWHWFLKSWWLQSDARFALEISKTITKPPQAGLHASEAVCIALISLSLAVLTWRLVELPVRRLEISRRLVVLLVTMLGSVIGLAWWIASTEGVALRLPAESRKLLISQDTELASYRLGECFLARGEDFAKALDPPDSCRDKARVGSPTVVLWGDSHAAQFVGGLRPLILERGWGLAQFTVAACAPFMEKKADWCERIFAAQWEHVKHMRPEIVLLAGSWSFASVEKASELAKSLGELGAKVFVIGPVPIWARPLPSLLQRQAISQRWHPEVNQSLLAHQSHGLLPDAAIFDDRVRSKLVNAQLISPLEVFCPQSESCLVTHQGVPVSWDQSHLSLAGSSLVAPFLLEAIHGKPKP